MEHRALPPLSPFSPSFRLLCLPSPPPPLSSNCRWSLIPSSLPSWLCCRLVVHGKSTAPAKPLAVGALAPGAISTFFIRRREHRGGSPTPYRYWLKWLVAVDTRLRLILAQKAHAGPTNDCATLPLAARSSGRMARSALEWCWPMRSSIVSATISTFANNSVPLALSQRSEARWAGNLLECVPRCAATFQQPLIASASKPRASLARSNESYPAKRRVVASQHNANKRFSSDWPTTFTNFGLPICDVLLHA